MSTRFKIFAWIAVLAVVGLIAAYVLELHWLGNTFGAGKLVGGSVVAGLLAGVLLGGRLQGRGEEPVDRLRIWAACLIVPALFAPLLGSWSNRLLSPYPTENVPFEFFEEKPFVESRFGLIEGQPLVPDGYYIFVVQNGEIERVKSKTQHFAGVQRGDMISLPVKKGLWGFGTVMVE